MKFFFGDDSRQVTPTRDQMGSLVAAGGVLVSAEHIRSLEQSLNELCRSFGFPEREPFKWSPGRELWMRSNLVRERRQQFFHEALDLAKAHDITAVVVIEDTTAQTATKNVKSAEEDVTCLLLERVEQQVPTDPGAVIIVDRPGGDRGDEERFLMQCVENIQTGTNYVQFNSFAINVLSANSKFLRLLQLADVITSCTTAYVGGEQIHAPPVVEKVKPLLAADMDRVGGIGVKIHPDFKYANLYHWLFGDTHYCRQNLGYPYPISRPYRTGPDKYHG